MTSKYLMDGQGKPSSMRLMALTGFMAGVVVVLSGTVAMFLGNPYCIQAITAGAGIIASGELAKSWQKQAENRGTTEGE